jgi:hypothetical protein
MVIGEIIPVKVEILGMLRLGYAVKGLELTTQFLDLGRGMVIYWARELMIVEGVLKICGNRRCTV